MKNQFLNLIGGAFFFLSVLAVNEAGAALPSNNGTPSSLNFSIAIPESLQSQIVRQDYENESIFSMNTGGKKTAFLFSVTKVTTDQWNTIKEQIGTYTILENKDGYITFLQKTKEKSIRGSGDAQYQQMLHQLDGIIATIHLN